MRVKMEEELRHLELGDARRNKRLVSLVNRLVTSPNKSIPSAGYRWSDIKMTYYFYNNSQVKHQDISASIQKATVERCMQNELVLCMHDTTNVAFKSSAPELGYLDHGKGKGLMLHSTLSIDAQGCPLGLVWQKVWARDYATMGKKATRHKRKITDKESYRWIEGIQQASSALKGISQVVHIADREADIYELIAMPRDPGTEFLVRCTHNRKTLLDNKMWDEIGQEPILARFEVEIGKPNSEATKKIKMRVRAGTVLLSPPEGKADLPAMMVNGLLVQQDSDGAGDLEWRLISTLAVDTAAAVLNQVKWYSYRWRIERFHYILKSGCRLEELQLRKKEALHKAIIVYSLAAFKLMQLLYLSRTNPDQPCTDYLDQQEWQLLVSLHSQSPAMSPRPPTLRQSVILIARLGGYLARNNDGPPGIKNLWRGLQELNAMIKAINHKQHWFSTF